MALTEWTVTTTDAGSITKAAVAGSSHYVTGIHVALMSDENTSDVPEAATVALTTSAGGGTTLFNSGAISNTDDLNSYYPFSGYPQVDIQFAHPLKVASGGSVVLTVAGMSASLSGDVTKKLNIFGYTVADVDKATEKSTEEGKAFPGQRGSSDSTWWRS